MYTSSAKYSGGRKESNYDTFASDVEEDAWFRGDSSSSIGGYKQPTVSLPRNPNGSQEISSFASASQFRTGGEERPLTLLSESSAMPTLNLPLAEPTVGQKMKKAITRASTMVGNAASSFSSTAEDPKISKADNNNGGGGGGAGSRKSMMVKMLGPLGFPVGQKNTGNDGAKRRRGPLMSMRTRGMAMGGLFGGGIRRDQSQKSERDTDWVMRGTKWMRKGPNDVGGGGGRGNDLMTGAGGNNMMIVHPQPPRQRQGGPTMEPVISGDFDMDEFDASTEGAPRNLRLASMAAPGIPPPSSRPKNNNRMSFMPSRLIKSVAIGMGLYRVKTHEHELVDTLANDIGIPAVSAAEVGKLFVNFNVDFEDFMLFTTQDFMNIGVGAVHAQMIVEGRKNIRRLHESSDASKGIDA